MAAIGINWKEVWNTAVWADPPVWQQAVAAASGGTRRQRQIKSIIKKSKRKVRNC